MDDFVFLAKPELPGGRAWVAIAVEIVHITTEQRATLVTEGIFNREDGAFEDWGWEEGNDSCDCNRAIYFARAQQDDAAEDAAWEGGCSHGQYAVRVTSTKTGEVVYCDFPADLAGMEAAHHRPERAP